MGSWNRRRDTDWSRRKRELWDLLAGLSNKMEYDFDYHQNEIPGIHRDGGDDYHS
ncbi:hypothetical protein Bca4012_049555 [Brassica carinata]